MRLSSRKKIEPDTSSKPTTQNVTQPRSDAILKPTPSKVLQIEAPPSEPEWRTIYVFPPNRELADDLKRTADGAGMSLSDFILARVQKSFTMDEIENERQDLQELLNEKDEELQRLRTEIEKLYVAKEEELRRLKSDLARSEGEYENLKREVAVLRSEEL